jgi:hypothetical protein
MDDLTAERERLDPLERIWRGRAVGLVAGLTVLLVFVISAKSHAPSDLPGIALGSPALLHTERALLTGAAVAVSFIFLIRGWAGYFPSKLSTTGAEYATWSSAEKALRIGDEAIDMLAEARLERVAMAKSVGEDIRALELKVEALASGAERVERPTANIDDMV